MAPPASNPSLLLQLPPELRNTIYIAHLSQYPEIILPTLQTTTATPRTPLIRVSHQLRAELSSLLNFCATHLLIRLPATQTPKLAPLLAKLDKRTLSALHQNSPTAAAPPSAAQLLAIQKSLSLRPRREQTGCFVAPVPCSARPGA